MVPSPMLVDVKHENKLEVGIKESLNQDETPNDSVRCTNNCEGTDFDKEVMLDQQADAPEAIEKDEVEVVEGVGGSANMFVEVDDPNATEYSSSFADTVSGNDDASRLSDAEVDSGFCVDNGLGSNLFDGFNSLLHMRKKKLTTHWKRYIQPLMWRCRWVELRVKEFRSQALRYERELASCYQRKQLELGQYASEGCGRTLPFCHLIHRKKVMKRRKRKRIEDTVDIPSYMSSHRLFSYYEETKSIQDADADEDGGNQVNVADFNSNDELDFKYERPQLEGRDSDNSIEQILWKIELAQSKVQKLKADIEKLPIDTVRFSCIEDLPSDLLTSLARSLSQGCGDEMPNGAHCSPPQHVPEHDIGILMAENAVSSYIEATPLLDITESNVAPSSGETLQPKVGDLCKDLVDNVLNNTAEKELQNIGKVRILPNKVKEEQVENKIVPAPVSDPEPAPVLDAEPAPTQEPEAEKKREQPAQEASVIKEETVQNISICSKFPCVPRKKRKIGKRRGSSSVGWNPEQISARRPSGV